MRNIFGILFLLAGLFTWQMVDTISSIDELIRLAPFSIPIMFFLFGINFITKSEVKNKTSVNNKEKDL